MREEFITASRQRHEGSLDSAFGVKGIVTTTFTKHGKETSLACAIVYFSSNTFVVAGTSINKENSPFSTNVAMARYFAE